MIKVSISGKKQVSPFVIQFSGGEIHPNFLQGLDEYHRSEGSYVVTAYLKNSNDIMELMLVSDILNREFPSADRYLLIPYLPYARQDRVCAPGDAFGLKVFCNMVNSLNYDVVRLVDPHSDVAPALLNNCTVMSMVRIIKDHPEVITDDAIIVSPDAGAHKKVGEIANLLERTSFVKADKIRDCTTGEITGTEVYCGDLTEETCFIFDDICDGGRTFIELAKKLREKGADKVFLYVTHGIFSKGVEVFDGLIDHIYTTNSFYDGKPTNLITVFYLEPLHV